MSDINSLRKTLFETMQGVKDGTINADQAKQIADIGQVIINSAKVEIEYAHKTGAHVVSGFLEAIPEKLPNGITAIHRHTSK